MATGRAIDFGDLLSRAGAATVERGWAFKQLEDFALNRDGLHSLVVLGDPGAGKSTLLGRLAHRLGCPHFFFGRTDGVAAENGGGWDEPIRCVETLGAQLVRQFGDNIIDWRRFDLDVRIRIGELSGEVIGAERSTWEFVPRPSGKASTRVDIEVSKAAPGSTVTGISIAQLNVSQALATQELFLNPLRRAATSTDETIVVVLDGLDEWDRQASPDDLLTIALRSSLPANVRFISSARRAYASRLDEKSLRLDISSLGLRAQLDSDIAVLVEQHPRFRGRVLSAEERSRWIERIAGNLLLGVMLLDSVEDPEGGGLHGSVPGDTRDFYRHELRRLVDSLTGQGLRAEIGPLLAVVCSAHEPIDLQTIAFATELPIDAAADILERLSTFIPTRDHRGEIRYFPYHKDFADFIDSEGAGLGLRKGSGSIRLATRLFPAASAPRAWPSASEYALRHLLRHAVDGGLATRDVAQRLLADPSYLVARVQHLGISALEADLRLAKSAQIDMSHLSPITAELSARSTLDVAMGTSSAQSLAAAAASIGARAEAQAFASLALEQAVAVPHWSAGFESVVAAGGMLRSDDICVSASMTSTGMLALVGENGLIEIWNLHTRQVRARLPCSDVIFAEAEPDGNHAWIVTRVDQRSSFVKRIRIADAAVVVSLELRQRVTALRIVPELACVVLGSSKGRILLLSLTDGARWAQAEQGFSVTCIRVDSGRLISLDSNRKLVSWSLPDLEPLAVHQIALNGDVAGFDDRTDGLVVEAGKCLAYVGAVDGSIFEVKLAEDEAQSSHRRLHGIAAWADHLTIIDERLLVGDACGDLHILDLGAESQPRRLRAHVSALRLCEHLVGTSLVVTVCKGGEICFWNLAAKATHLTLGHTRAVHDVVFSNGGDRLMSTGIDGSLVEWTQEGDARVRAWLHPERLQHTRLTADLSTVVYEDDSGHLQREQLHAMSTELVSTTAWPRKVPDKCLSIFTSALPRSIAITNDASIAVVEKSSQCLLFCQFDPIARYEYLDDESPAGRHALSSDGKWLLTVGPKKELFVRRLDERADRDTRRTVPGGGRLLCEPFSTMGGTGVLLYRDGSVICMDLESFEVRRTWIAWSEPKFALVLPDAQTCVQFGSGGCIEFIALANGRRLGGFVARPPASAAALSPDGCRIALGDEGGNVQCFDLRLRQGVPI